MYQVRCDNELLKLLKEDSAAAFDEIYKQYSQPLYIYLLNKLKDPDLCDDVLQDLFTSLWEKREGLNIEISLKAYLYQSARYKIIDIYRHNINYQSYADDLANRVDMYFPNLQDSVHKRLQLQEVIRDINRLPLRMKEVFLASRFEYLSIKEIAAKYKISPQTVKNQLSKALQILRLNHSHTIISFFILLFFRKKF